MSKLDIKIEAESNLTDIFASCDDGECGHDDSCSSDDSDSHCCTCCNCNCGKQKMKKELLRQRLRKKLKLRKLRQTATSGDIDVNLQRARKLLLQRLQYPRKKHKSIQPQFPTSFIIEDSQGRIIVLTKQKIVFLINFHIPVTDICHCGLFIAF